MSRKLALCAALWVFATTSHAQVGADWLQSQAKPDGSFGAAADLATPYQATAEAVRTLRLFGRASVVGAAEGFLNAETWHGAEYLARKVTAHSDAGTAIPGLLTELLAAQNGDGGFGELPGYQSRPLDTAFALEALAAGGLTTGSPVALAVAYLLQNQGSDGSWTRTSGASEVDVTALAIRALHPYRAQHASIPQALANARAYLVSQADGSGVWPEDFLTATALLSLAISSPDLSALTTGVEVLRGRQLANGSWQNDVYTTALALRALRAYDARAAGGTASTAGGTVLGYVFKAGSGEPLANVQIGLGSQVGASVLSNSRGFFMLNAVPAGDQTVVLRKAGYTPANRTAKVYAGQTTNLGSVYLGATGEFGFVEGVVLDAITAQALSGATVTLTGPSGGTATTAGDGRFELGALGPGAYAIAVGKSGYRAVAGELVVVAGATSYVRQPLVPDGVFADDAPVALSARTVNAATESAASGVQAVLSTGASALSGADGGLAFAAVPRGSYRIDLSGTGFSPRSYYFVLSPGDTGKLGDLRIHPQTGTTPSSTLTVHGQVVDSVSNAPLAGATATLTATGATRTADAEGRFSFEGLTQLSVELTVAAAGYETRVFSFTASGYGDIASVFPLPPGGGNDAATSSTLRGSVLDSSTGAGIPGATVIAIGTPLSATTDAGGLFQIGGIETLEFRINVAAGGYFSRDYDITFTRHGVYDTQFKLDPSPDMNRFQIVSLVPAGTGTGAEVLQTFIARVANVTPEPQSTLVIGEILNGAGEPVATVTPYAPGTTSRQSAFSFGPQQEMELTIPWNPAQVPPGTYRLVLRLVEPGSISRELPSGVVLTQAETAATVAGTHSIKGELGFDPPLVQAGTNQAIALTALVLNGGNVPLTAPQFVLTVRDPANGQPLLTREAGAELLEVGRNVLLDFGSWVPSKAGDLPVSVRAKATGVPGEVSGTLYVGDKATGNFTVDRSVVPLGTQTVRGHVALQGVDVRTGTSTDPLFFAVKEAIRKGGELVGPAAKAWHQSGQCLGCHTQTQSFLGLSAARDKAAIDETAVQFLHNTLAGSQQDDGGIRLSHAHHTKVQTALGMWALAEADDSANIYRTLDRAADHMLARKSSNSTETWWATDHCGAYWCDTAAMNALTVHGMSALLKHAEALGSTPATGYSLVQDADLGVQNVEQLVEGPDGWLWYLDYNGALRAKNLTTLESRTIATGIRQPAYGLAVRADGTAFVTSQYAVTRISPQGAKTEIVSGTGYGYLTDVVFAPDGSLYVLSYSQNRILKVTESGAVTTFASSGLFSSPYSLAYGDDGNLLVANYGGRNILSVTPGGVTSVWSSGTTAGPSKIKRMPNGDFLVSAYPVSENPAALYRFTPQGYAERIFNSGTTSLGRVPATGIVGGKVYASGTSGSHLRLLVTVPISATGANTVRQELPKIARYQLNRHKDNTGNNLTHAWRLMSLGEIAQHTTDTAFKNELNTAIAFIANLLRARQRADGGWGHTTGHGSDSLVTSAVGIALDYTNPSVNDPLVRKAITYLLNQQQSDKSWPNENGIFSTKLASTSFVMAYLPLALERLGGIDIDLNIVTPPNVALSNPTAAPTSQAATPDGGVAYRWYFQGVTAKERDLGFDLTLRDMSYQEQRAVAAETFLTFANSFNNQAVRSDLGIPRVRAVSDLALSLATDKPSYPAYTPVAITSLVNNIGPAVDSGHVHLYLRSSDGSTTLRDLGIYGFGAIAQGGSTSLASGLNTDTLAVGPYQLYGRLFDQTGRLADEASTAFTIVNETPVLTAAISADKPTYQAWDSVALSSRVQNVSRNASQPPSIAEVTVKTPGGEVIYFNTYNVNELAAGGVLTFPGSLPLSDALSGEYPVDLVVKDASTRAVVASAATRFSVERDSLQGLTGKVTVERAQVHQGDPNVCTDSATNISRHALNGVDLIKTLVSLDRGDVIASSSSIQDFLGEERKVDTRTIGTRLLPLGGYACVLSATYGGRTRQLGSAGFMVIEPPIRIQAALGLGGKGRVLILMDGDPPPNSIPKTESSYPAQRAFLENLLTRNGWSYTIVTDKDAFAWELRTGDYSIYLLVAEHEKIDETVQKELREAVFRGEGLVDAGEHDQRHHNFDDALGIKHIGHHADARSIELFDSALIAAGHAELTLKDKTLRASLTAAQPFGRYLGVTTSEDMAVAARDYGRGRSVYMGFDTLAEATLAGEQSLFAQLILRGLEHVQPAYAQTAAGQLVPLRLTLTNEGVATPGRALVTLPAGTVVADRASATVEGGVLTWLFELAEKETKELTAWVRLPDASPATFSALIQSGVAPDYADHVRVDLSLTPEPRPALDEARTLAASDIAFKQVQLWLDKAAASIAANQLEAALGDLVKAADEAMKVTHQEARNLRWMIDEALLETGRRL